jgi:hypothetical protein
VFDVVSVGAVATGAGAADDPPPQPAIPNVNAAATHKFLMNVPSGEINVRGPARAGAWLTQ